MPDVRPKKVTYFRVESDTTLHKMLMSVCSSVDEADREWQPTAGSDERRVLTELETKANCYCGSLIKYEEGMRQHLFVKPEKGKHEGRTETAEAGLSDEGWEREVVESAVYFAVYGNHVAVVQSVSLTHNSLQEHFEWLLSEYSDDFGEGDLLELKREVTKDAKEVFEQEPITQIQLRDNINAFAYGTGSENNTKHKGTRSKTTSTHILNPNWLENLAKEDKSLAKVIKQGGAENIECCLVIKVSKRKAEEAQAVVKKMAETLGEESFEKTKFIMKSGKPFEGGNIIVQEHLKIDFNNGVISQFDVYRSISQWLVEQVSSGNVSSS